jgi:uncharacterized protein (DUF488 family)
VEKKIYTIGHSNRSIEKFIALLEAQGIEQLVDVRTVPKSRYNPQFGGEALAASLKEKGISYNRIAALGGFRKTRPDSKNLGWRNLSFRGYADYLATPEFAAGLKELEELAVKRPTAFMCSEAVPWRCHRSLIADALMVRGWEVLDIMALNKVTPHKLTAFLKVVDGELTYPEESGMLPLV